jgi:phosphoesterase RecJ-like protein
LGSILGLARGLRAVGKQARLLLQDPVPRQYETMLADEDLLGPADFDAAVAAADRLMILDTASIAQLGKLAERIAAHGEKLLIVDHHATNDALTESSWFDTSAAAVGLMVLELLESLSWPIDKATADVLAAAILTDTGWMRFSNTDARCLHAMARLWDRGVRLEEHYARLYQNDRPQRLRLMQRGLASLELHADDRLALMMIRQTDFAETGADRSETENLINEAMRLATVELAVMLTETPGQIRVSFRSRRRVDVSQLAATLGGGGHARAAGCRLPRPLDDARQTLLAACKTALEDSAGQCAADE